MGPWSPEGWPGTEVGWSFLREAGGKGYATEAATAAIDWAFDALGWAGSVLLVVSLLQARVIRFRVLNLVASLVLTGFNALIEVWPMVAMNVVLAGINLWFIARMLRDRNDDDVAIEKDGSVSTVEDAHFRIIEGPQSIVDHVMPWSELRWTFVPHAYSTELFVWMRVL